MEQLHNKCTNQNTSQTVTRAITVTAQGITTIRQTSITTPAMLSRAKLTILQTQVRQARATAHQAAQISLQAIQAQAVHQVPYMNMHLH